MTKDQKSVLSDIKKFVKENSVLTLAVAEKNKPWVCTLYYGTDNDLNLYIVTDPQSVHGKIIEKNNQISFNIFDSHQKITKPTKGLQGRGTISHVKGVLNTSKALLIWHKANPGIEKDITVEDILLKLSENKVYIVKPTYLKYFNKVLYSPNRYGEITLN